MWCLVGEYWRLLSSRMPGVHHEKCRDAPVFQGFVADQAEVLPDSKPSPKSTQPSTPPLITTTSLALIWAPPCATRASLKQPATDSALPSTLRSLITTWVESPSTTSRPSIIVSLLDAPLKVRSRDTVTDSVNACEAQHDLRAREVVDRGLERRVRCRRNLAFVRPRCAHAQRNYEPHTQRWEINWSHSAITSSPWALIRPILRSSLGRESGQTKAKGNTMRKSWRC